MNVRRGRDHREKRRVVASIIREERAQRTPAQQLATLDERLGVGVGAARERARLIESMSPKELARYEGK